jgi:hypothetical protein
MNFFKYCNKNIKFENLINRYRAVDFNETFYLPPEFRSFHGRQIWPEFLGCGLGAIALIVGGLHLLGGNSMFNIYFAFKVVCYSLLVLIVANIGLYELGSVSAILSKRHDFASYLLSLALMAIIIVSISLYYHCYIETGHNLSFLFLASGMIWMILILIFPIHTNKVNDDQLCVDGEVYFNSWSNLSGQCIDIIHYFSVGCGSVNLIVGLILLSISHGLHLHKISKLLIISALAGMAFSVYQFFSSKSLIASFFYEIIYLSLLVVTIDVLITWHAWNFENIQFPIEHRITKIRISKLMVEFFLCAMIVGFLSSEACGCVQEHQVCAN